MHKVIVCGGAGYIGSHVVLSLVRCGYRPIVIDNFLNSHRDVLVRLSLISGVNIEWYEVDLLDGDCVLELFSKIQPDAVVQLAGLKAVEHSVLDPLTYYRSNLGITLNVLAAMSRLECGKIIFSSSATVYGNPRYVPIDEVHPVDPVSPYGRTKYFQEELIQDWIISARHSFSGVVLRYFNPVGADVSGLIGEDAYGVPTNLMPVLGGVALGLRKDFVIFGDNYETRDGTCERDFIHVSDLADAHVAALSADVVDRFEVFNVGTGSGITVKEAVDTYSSVVGTKLQFRLGDRRIGDTAISIASNEKILRGLNWRPMRTFVDACRDDFTWRSKSSTLSAVVKE